MKWLRALQNHVEIPYEWKVSGYEVIDKAEKSLAQVLDLLCEEGSGKVRYLMVEIGGLMGIAGKKVLIPAGLIVRAGAGTLIVSSTMEEIQQAPFIDDPDNPSRAEEERIFIHFATEPYWDSLEEEEEPEAEDQETDETPEDGNNGNGSKGAGS